jgi:DNA replication protein DnaC
MNGLKERVRKIGLNSVISDWQKYEKQEWLPALIEAEERERDKRSLERRIREARIGHFKPMTDFDWDWPDEIDRPQVEELFTLNFMEEKANVVLVGNNGLGKSMIAQNLANTALMQGINTRFVKASDMLNELVECDGSMARRRCLKKYCKTGLLVIDEVGYMNYDNRFADLLYEVISGRYRQASTVITTNKVYGEWSEIFPNAACVITLVDRLTHHAETIHLKRESFRHREAMERTAAKERERKKPGRKKREFAATD